MRFPGSAGNIAETLWKVQNSRYRRYRFFCNARQQREMRKKQKIMAKLRRAIKPEEWDRHTELLEILAAPKVPPKPRLPKKKRWRPVNMRRIEELSTPVTREMPRARDPFKVAKTALTYKISKRTQKIAYSKTVAEVIPPRILGAVSPAALKADGDPGEASRKTRRHRDGPPRRRVHRFADGVEGQVLEAVEISRQAQEEESEMVFAPPSDYLPAFCSSRDCFTLAIGQSEHSMSQPNTFFKKWQESSNSDFMVLDAWMSILRCYAIKNICERLAYLLTECNLIRKLQMGLTRHNLIKVAVKYHDTTFARLTNPLAAGEGQQVKQIYSNTKQEYSKWFQKQRARRKSIGTPSFSGNIFTKTNDTSEKSVPINGLLHGRRAQ
ncbi:hypothetical protein WN51_05017 [Melipona quadrifasciata]|uniref:Uncharacterized protein n=1 Tax=Melipona quadrifasciata TaxID=166423 RepID=A0A0N0U3R4_9HYME|nr:hypothetical protein WN51_05017 [Melipona quadrifasciata]